MYKYVFVVFCLFASCVWANEPIRPRANESVTGLFLRDDVNSVESYFYREQLSRYEGGANSYVLVNYPVFKYGGPVEWEEAIQGDIPEYKLDLFGGVWNPWIKLQYQWQWWYSDLTRIGGYVYFEYQNEDGYSHIYPSFREDGVNRGQCVAFAKIATQEFLPTGYWHAAKNVMERAWDVYAASYGEWWYDWYQYYDPSLEHRGRMIAFFGENGRTGSVYPQSKDNTPGHVGIFLKYAYDEYGRPIGFWMADENYEGTPYWNNPDGRIRKHLVLVNPVPNGYGYAYGHTYANNYFYVEIPQ